MSRCPANIATVGAALRIVTPSAVSTPDTAFRWSSTDQQWIFNINTKGLSIAKYSYRITLNDGSTIDFAFTLKK